MLTGRTVHNRFRIGSFLGKGSQGEVYRLYDCELPDRPLVIKLFGESFQGHDQSQSLTHEIRYACGFHHPNLIKIFESGILLPEKKPFYIAEFFPGKPIYHLFPENFSIPHVFEILLQLFSGLDYLHQSGLIHLDIKPSNVLVAKGKFFKTKLIDFGTLLPQHFSGKVRFGSFFYMSPNLLCGKRPQVQDDLYSVGVLLYQWLVGRLPFTTKNPENFVGRIRLGLHPFKEVDLKPCKGFACLTKGLLFGNFTSVKQVQRYLQNEGRENHFFPEATQSKLCLPFPPSRFSPIFVQKIQSSLKKILDPSCGKKTLIFTGPKGAGKATLCQKTVEIYSQEKGILYLHLPALPHQSVSSTVRILSEKSALFQSFSGLDPLATTQALTVSKRRKHFFDLVCQMVGDIVKRHGNVILFFESVTVHDFSLWELILAINHFSKNKNLSVAVIISLHVSQSLKLESKKMFSKNCYLHEIAKEYLEAYFPLKPLTLEKTKNFLIHTLGDIPQGLLKVLSPHSKDGMLTPGTIREFLEVALGEGQLTHKKGTWEYRPRRKKPYDPKEGTILLKAILPLLPQPIQTSSLEILFKENKVFRKNFVQLVQDGYFIKDENRYFWSGSIIPKVNYNFKEKTLAHWATQDPVYFLPLCHLFPSRKNAQKILAFLRNFEGTDYYFPFSQALENLLRNIPHQVPRDRHLKGLLYFHLGRIHNFHNALEKAEKSLRKAITFTARTDPQQRFLIYVKLANVYAKKGQHQRVIHLLEKVSFNIYQNDEKNFIKAMICLARGLQSGPDSFPLNDLEAIIASIDQDSLSGRMILRYVQALLWAGKKDLASLWIEEGLDKLKKSSLRISFARTLRMKAKVYRDAGELEKALECNEASLALLKESSFPREELETLIAIFYLQKRLGQDALLKEYLCRIGVILSSLPDSDYDLLWPELMALSKEKENPSEALNFYRIQEKLAKTHNSPRHLYVAFSRQAFLENFLGNMKESQRIWKKAQKIYEKHCHNFPQRLREKHAFPLEIPS